MMPLHDAVGINCEKRTTTENQGANVKYMGKGCMLDDCVCVIRLCMTTLLGTGRKLWYIILYKHGLVNVL